MSGELVSGDSFTLLGEEYATAEVGTNLTLIPRAAIEDGNGGGNYVLTLVNDTTGEIRSAVDPVDPVDPLDLSELGASHTAATLSNASNDGQAEDNAGDGSGSADGIRCTDGEDCKSMVRVIATGLRLSLGIVGSELDDFSSFSETGVRR